MLLAKWDTNHGTVMEWLHVRLSFVILYATLLCVWGSPTKWCALGLVDGVSIAIGQFCFCFVFHFELIGHHGFLVHVTIVFLVSGFVIWP